MPAFDRIFRNQRQIEHEGFFQGAQGADSSDALSAIATFFAQQQEAAALKSLPRIKRIEATIEQARQGLTAARSRLSRIEERLGDHMPEVAIPLMILLVGLFAMISEALMLAPSMDMLNITDPFFQRIAGFAICGVAAILIHFALESLTPGRFRAVLTALFRTLGSATVAGLACVGILRGHQAAYGAALNDSPLAGFLKNWPVLCMLVYTFLTVAFPVAAATAMTFAVKALREWREYLAARRAVQQLTKALATLPKQLEAERETLDHQQKQIAQKQKQWQASYLDEYDRGRTIGGSQMPIWMVWLRALIGGLFAYLLAALHWGPLCIYTFTATAIVFLLVWIYNYHLRLHPKPNQFYRRPKVEFRSAIGNGGSR